MMLRQCITFLRTRGFSAVLPLDHHIYLHKLTGVMIAIYSFVHTLMHLMNFSIVVVNDPVINARNFTLAEWFFTARPGLFGLIGGVANPTGFALFVILLIMFICSQPFVRRKGSFEVFYWTHLLYIPFWILVIFHGPNFWKWFIGPGVIYLIERVFRFVWMKSEYGKTYISSGLLLPSRVTHLVIKRPSHFYFRPGDYVFVNIPVIATYEWHPFTISSAPEQEDYMWLHIRGVGEWTNSLYAYFEREQERLHNGEVPPHRRSIQSPDLLSSKSTTPQTDFLAKNLSRMHNNQTFDSGLTPKSNDNENPTNGDRNSVTPQRPPRFNPGTSRLAIDSYPAETAKYERQNSESRPTIKNIKASLQRTFSRKENREKTGVTNEGFISDASDPNSRTKMLLAKVPLEKSLSVPDMENRMKKRERLMA